jgi:hypothetical protein
MPAMEGLSSDAAGTAVSDRAEVSPVKVRLVPSAGVLLGVTGIFLPSLMADNHPKVSAAFAPAGIL